MGLGVGCLTTLLLYFASAPHGATESIFGWVPALAAGALAGALWPLAVGAALWAALLWAVGALAGG